MSRLSCDRTQAPFTPASEGQLIHVVATHRRTIYIMSLSWVHLSWVQSIIWAQCSTCMLCHYYAEIFGCVAKRLDYMNQITEHFRLALHMLKHLNAWRQSQPHSNGCCGCIVGVPGVLRARQLVLSPVLIGSHTIWQQQGFASHLLGSSSAERTSRVKRITFRTYRQVSNIRRTKSQHLKDSPTVLQLSLQNPLKPDVKSRMKM